MANYIGFEAFIIGVTNQTYILRVEEKSASVVYVPFDSLIEPPVRTVSKPLIKGKFDGKLTIVTALDSDRSHPNVVGTFTESSQLKIKETTFGSIFENEAKDFTGDTKQGAAIKLGNYIA